MTGSETRAAGAATLEGRTLRGYAATFNDEVVIAGIFREKLAYGCFTDSLNSDVLALLNHDLGRVIGRTTSGTLRLRQDAKGLAVEIDLPDSPDGQTAWALVTRQDLKGMSFAFVPTEEDWDDSGPGLPLRTIRSLELVEVSCVAIPAYPTTSIKARSKAKASAAAIAARMRMSLAMRERSLRA